MIQLGVGNPCMLDFRCSKNRHQTMLVDSEALRQPGILRHLFAPENRLSTYIPLREVYLKEKHRLLLSDISKTSDVNFVKNGFKNYFRKTRNVSSTKVMKRNSSIFVGVTQLVQVESGNMLAARRPG